MTSRRQFVSRATLAAAAAGLPPVLHAEILAASRRSSRPWVEMAARCARWIGKSAQPVDGGLRWPADPLKPEEVGLDFYNGMTGVVAFHAMLFDATGEAAWGDTARAGADHLAHQMDGPSADLDAGLYSGLGGLAYTFGCLHRARLGDRYRDAAVRAAGQIAARARTVGEGAEWSDSNDIISGTAGTGLFLLGAGRSWKQDSLVALAIKAGHRLVATGEAAEGGTMWYPAASFRRNYPNFSHGTSGVSYFLATLYEQTREPAFLNAALAGARYLDAVAHRENGTTKIFHSTDGGENRYYLSWCHGPVGTARLFYRLHRITGEPRWLDWVDSLTKAVLESGVPEGRTTGYWNNISQCCGNVGIGQYCIDLARYHRSPALAAYRERVVKDTIARATDDADGLRWVQAENRVSPEGLVAQTGFMQGAAGVGTFFLQLDALERGAKWKFPQPDTPFAG
ncbi:MAG TPA: lanthionine synthetase LanC family protein [Gemmatimonadales bacterium]|nr:lanthionine synthetase LanC family protein [Gemmatimonadales bacterium]